MNARRTCLAVMAGIVLGGCATPEPVRELADKSAANVGIVGARLRQLRDESQLLYNERSGNIARMQQGIARTRAEYTLDLALTEKIGQDEDVAMAEELLRWVQRVDKIRADAAAEETKRREALQQARQEIDVRTKELQKIAEILSALARQESAAERARLLRDFVVEVRDDVKKQLDDGSQTSKDAKALLDHLKSKREGESGKPAGNAP